MDMLREQWSADSSFKALFAVENAQADAPTDGIGTAS